MVAAGVLRHERRRFVAADGPKGFSKAAADGAWGPVAGLVGKRDSIRGIFPSVAWVIRGISGAGKDFGNVATL